MLFTGRSLVAVGIWTHASEPTGALNLQRLTALDHATRYGGPGNSNQLHFIRA